MYLMARNTLLYIWNSHFQISFQILTGYDKPQPIGTQMQNIKTLFSLTGFQTAQSESWQRKKNSFYLSAPSTQKWNNLFKIAFWIFFSPPPLLSVCLFVSDNLVTLTLDTVCVLVHCMDMKGLAQLFSCVRNTSCLCGVYIGLLVPVCYGMAEVRTCTFSGYCETDTATQLIFSLLRSTACTRILTQTVLSRAYRCRLSLVVAHWKDAQTFQYWWYRKVCLQNNNNNNSGCNFLLT